MTILAPRSEDASGRVLVTGGPHPTGADTEELAALGSVVTEAGEELRQARGWLEDARHHLTTWSHLAPAEARSAALAIEQCLDGPNGCTALESDLTGLADHLDRVRVLYAEAEQHTAALFRPSLLRHLWMTMPAIRLPGVPVGLSPHALLTALPAAATLLADARGGQPHAVLAQRAVRGAAEDLQHAFPYYRREDVLLRGELVDPAALTPTQRVALGVLPLLAAMPAAGQRGRTLTDAWGVPTVVASVPRRLTGLPGSESALLRRTAHLGEQARASGAGMVEILRSTAPDGRRSWTVVIPGTQEQWPGGDNPMDNLSNVQLMAGAVSDMELAVATAMRQAGIGPQETVAIAAHSQGALVAARLLRDPLFASRYRVSTLLTAGGPIGGLRLPGSVAALSLEDVDDPVVGLDGLANAPAPNHLTAMVDTRGLREGFAHDLSSYARGAELLATVDDPAVQDWRRQHREATGADRAGAVTHSTVFEVVRSP